MKEKGKLFVSVIIAIVFIALSFVAVRASVKESNNTGSCYNHPNKMWAWTLENAWMSTDKTGDWKTDNWFYLLKSGESVAVLQYDAETQYYLVCYDFEKEGWNNLVGWVYKDAILLQSQITPIAP